MALQTEAPWDGDTANDTPIVVGAPTDENAGGPPIEAVGSLFGNYHRSDSGSSYPLNDIKSTQWEIPTWATHVSIVLIETGLDVIWSDQGDGGSPEVFAASAVNAGNRTGQRVLRTGVLDYDIEWSADGIVWEEVGTDSPAATLTSANTYQRDEFAVKGRYMRLSANLTIGPLSWRGLVQGLVK